MSESESTSTSTSTSTGVPTITTIGVPTSRSPEYLDRVLRSVSQGTQGGRTSIRPLTVRGLSAASARNLILQETRGEQIVMVDDDVVAQLTQAPVWWEPGEKLLPQVIGETAVSGDPTGFWPESFTFSEGSDSDVIKLHQEALSGGALTSHLGVNGDCGMESTAYLLFLEGESRDRILGSAECYRRALYVRRLMRCAPRRRDARTGPSLTACVGVDNTGARGSVIPPFPEISRNSDGVWVEVMRAVNPAEYQAYLPWAIRHDPPEARVSDPAAGAGTLRSSDLLVLLVWRWGSVEGSLRQLGAWLEDLAGQWPSEMWRMLEEDRHDHRIRQIEEVGRLLDTYQGPAYWRADLVRYVEMFVENSLRPLVPVDLPGGREEFGRVVCEYGKQMQEW